MKKYLVDVKFSYFFLLWYKIDSDFSHRIILHNPPLRVTHIRFGNIKIKEFFYILSSHWNDIQEMSNNLNW